MKTKLTLTVNRTTVQKAKNYLEKSSKSLSSVIENFLESLASRKTGRSAVDASRGLLKRNHASMRDKEIRRQYYRERHGV